VLFNIILYNALDKFSTRLCFFFVCLLSFVAYITLFAIGR